MYIAERIIFSEITVIPLPHHLELRNNSPSREPANLQHILQDTEQFSPHPRCLNKLTN